MAATVGEPPSISTPAPAAIAAAAPVSAWQPPSAPLSDARAATTAPISPAVARPLISRVIGNVAPSREPEQHARQHAGAAGGRRGDDDAHRRVHFLHRQRVASTSVNSVPDSGPVSRLSLAASPPTSPLTLCRSPGSPRATAPRMTVSARPSPASSSARVRSPSAASWRSASSPERTSRRDRPRHRLVERLHQPSTLPIARTLWTRGSAEQRRQGLRADRLIKLINVDGVPALLAAGHLDGGDVAALRGQRGGDRGHRARLVHRDDDERRQRAGDLDGEVVDGGDQDPSRADRGPDDGHLALAPARASVRAVLGWWSPRSFAFWKVTSRPAVRGQFDAVAEPLVVGPEPEQAAGDGAVGAVALAGARERPVQLDERAVGLAPEQCPREEPDTAGPRRVGRRGPDHDGSDDVQE